MELGQVEAFVEANRRGSISRAADALGLTQPTCTARLHGLERELGAQLLVRGRRGVSLTPAGRGFLPPALAPLEAPRRRATQAEAGSETPRGPPAPRLPPGPPPLPPPPPPPPLPAPPPPGGEPAA